jgi:hypothetical protein
LFQFGRNAHPGLLPGKELFAFPSLGNSSMFYKFSSVVAMLAMCAGSLVADDKDKKEATKEAIKQEAIKGSVSNFDQAKHSLTLKTDAGEKDYSIPEDVMIVFATGQKVSASQKPTAGARGRLGRPAGPQILAFVLKNGNKVELVFAEKENKVKEVHWDNRGADAPQGKPAGAPAGTKSTPKDAPKDAPKKDDGK